MSELRIVELSESVSVPLTVDRAFTRVVEQFDTWWVAPLRGPSCQAAQIEHRVGGLVWEDHGSATGLMLGTVRELHFGRRVVVDGVFGLDGALAGSVTLTVTGDDGGATVSVEQTAFGTMSAESESRHRSGWQNALEALARAGQLSA